MIIRQQRGRGIALCLVVSGYCIALGVHGETPAADRARATATPEAPLAAVQSVAASNNTPGINAPKLPGDAEYGEQVILARRANWEPWSFAVDAEYDFTNNAALASAGELSDRYLRTGVAGRYTNRIAGNWFTNFAVDGHALFYQRYDALDFLLLKGDAGLMYRVPWLADTFLSAGYSGYWISNSDLTTEAFHNHAVALSAQKIWKVSRAMQVIVGTSAEYSLAADPAPPQRHEYAAYLGYRLRLTDKFSIDASYRAAWYEYEAFDRQDWNHVVQLSASYNVTEAARLSVSTSASWNRSSNPTFNYNNIVGGVSVGLTLAF